MVSTFSCDTTPPFKSSRCWLKRRAASGRSAPEVRSLSPLPPRPGTLVWYKLHTLMTFCHPELVTSPTRDCVLSEARGSALDATDHFTTVFCASLFLHHCLVSLGSHRRTLRVVARFSNGSTEASAPGKAPDPLVAPSTSRWTRVARSSTSSRQVENAC